MPAGKSKPNGPGISQGVCSPASSGQGHGEDEDMKENQHSEL